VGGGYDPADLRSAYDLPSESAGSGQTVAIVDAYDDPNAESDLAVYRTRYRISACTTANGCFRKVNQTGSPKYPTANAEWAVEISLDLDMVSAACPNCHILLVEASSNTNTNLYTAEDEAATLGATEISNSWGGGESSTESTGDSFFDHPGVPITAAAGDSGYGVEYPAASPDVIAVGGTALTRASNTRGWSESAWSGTGSGCSAYEPKPAWQTDKGCADRTDNDVAAVASTETPVSIADSYKLPREFSVPEAGWTLVAGTSVASPLVAGTMALANAYTRSFPGAEALYEEAAQNGTGVLDNVVSGSNGSCGTYLCNAGSGYNGPTGLGSPYGAPVVLPPVQQEPQGSWVGKVGSAGYLLGGWDGAQDVSDMPNVTSTLEKGSRWQWAANTTDVRALQAPEGSTRNAATYYDPNQVQVKLSFATTAYSGSLHLYAVDWDSTARRESITVNDGSGPRTVLLNAEFHNGAWVSFPVNVAIGGSVTITVNHEAGANAVLSGIFLGDAGAPPSTGGQQLSEGGWISSPGTGAVVGSGGYDLAGWDGPTGDVSYIPNATVSLVQGTRYQWAANTTEARALSEPGQLTRNAAAYYDPNQVQVKLSFSAAYTGNLHLYAVDWDTTARRETITVDGQTAVLSSSFHEGAWVSFPISVAAGGTVTITVDRTAGPNAVLSGIFLGEGGTIPGPAVASAPQGAWVGAVGSAGYDLASWDGAQDVSYLPNASVSLLQGSRFQWAAGSSDARALSDPTGVTHNAGTYYDPNQIRLQLSFTAAYTGNLHLYAVDWDKQTRREIITVNGQSAELGDFSEGAWVAFPISVAAGGTVTITVDRTFGPNAVLSGIFLGDVGALAAAPVSSAPQGNWVSTYGSAGYDLFGFSGSSDLTLLPHSTASIVQGTRYQWATGTTDVRALQNPEKTITTRVAATLYDPNQIRVQLGFTEKYSGNLELYAVDWDSTARREMISVNGQTAVLSSEFNAGAWVSFPLNVQPGETVTITVDRLAGANAVLSGIFLG
jgi:hypothetical protein